MFLSFHMVLSFVNASLISRQQVFRSLHVHLCLHTFILYNKLFMFDIQQQIVEAGLVSASLEATDCISVIVQFQR